MSRTYECCACCPDDDPVYHSENPPNSHMVPCVTCRDRFPRSSEELTLRLAKVTEERDRLRAQVRTIGMVAKLWVDAAQSQQVAMSDEERRWSMEAGTAILESL